MLEFTQPADHDRFNSWLYEMLNMKICGSVSVPGAWDCYETLDYLECRLKQSVIATLREDGSIFRVRGKTVYFEDDRVTVIQNSVHFA
jgi:hypothetical protein